jgi:hypothetical protein
MLQAYSNVLRTFVCTVGALAVSSVFLFAAAGPAQAQTANVGIVDVVTTTGPIAY